MERKYQRNETDKYQTPRRIENQQLVITWRIGKREICMPLAEARKYIAESRKSEVD